MKEAYPDKIKIISGIRNATENTYQEYIDFRECVDAYVCVSSDITREMIKRGIEEKRVHTMICPVNCPQNLTRLYTTERTKPIRLGYAGRIVVSQKRMDLMEMLVETLEVRKVNYYFELAGEGDYGDKMQEYRKLFLRGERKMHPICCDCGQLRQGQPDDIDPFAAELLRRF